MSEKTGGEIAAEAYAEFDAWEKGWREECDPNGEVPVEILALIYVREGRLEERAERLRETVARRGEMLMTLSDWIEAAGFRSLEMQNRIEGVLNEPEGGE